MHEPLETVDARAGWDVGYACDGDGSIVRCGSGEGCACWAHAEGFVDCGAEVGEGV